MKSYFFFFINFINFLFIATKHDEKINDLEAENTKETNYLKNDADSIESKQTF